MAVINNLNTTQTPLTTGRTGAQVIKFLDAPRVYLKSKDGSSTPIIVKSNGVKPAGYTDLGIVDGKVAIAYDKEIVEVKTGVDEILRQTYIKNKTGSFEFVLSQFDDVAVEQLSGLTPSVVTAGSVVQFALGQDDIIERAVILVVQNKLDGKEWQFYSPAAQLSFTVESAGEFTVLRGRCKLPAFAHGGLDTIMVGSIFA
jgi:hypothetical protein